MSDTECFDDSNSVLNAIRTQLKGHVPTDWQLTTLGNALKWSSGGTPKRTEVGYFDGDIPWAVIGDLNDGVVTETANHITQEGLRNSSAKWVEPGSVLLAMYGSIGKLGIAGCRMTTNQAIAFTNPRPINSRYRLFFTNAEFSHYLTVTENDDLSISFDPYGNGSYKPIDQLSAGQRCTAMFPLLLQLKQGPLVIDQPEDNLDNRHIASKISPVIARDKVKRQIIMTSHNANLLVLSDPENVVVYEGTGVTGVIVEQGFLATRESKVTKHVLDILDGGEKALEMRYAKYGGRVA